MAISIPIPIAIPISEVYVAHPKGQYNQVPVLCGI